MIKFLYDNLFDSATLTKLNETTGYEAVNVQDRFLKKTYRSTGLTEQWLKFDMGSSKTVTLFTAFNNNFTTSAAFKLFGHATDLGNIVGGWSGASFQRQFTTWDETVITMTLNETHRWWLFTVSDPTNPAGFIEVGRVFGGASVSPDENFSETLSEEILDPSEQLWSVGQHAYSVQRERYTNFNFSFLDIDSGNQEVLRTLWESVYKTEPFVISFDDTDHPLDWTRYGLFTSDMAFSYTANGRANSYLSFRELR